MVLSVFTGTGKNASVTAGNVPGRSAMPGMIVDVASVRSNVTGDNVDSFIN